MLNTFNTPVKTLFSQDKDSQSKRQHKKQVFLPQTKKFYNLIYSTKINMGEEKL